MSETTHLMLPYLAAAQAQKHVTHNEAIRLLDGLVQLGVLDRDLTAPPSSPADGARYIVASGGSGAWSGWDLNVAYWVDGAWTRLVPREGWLAWVADEDVLLAFDGAAWAGVGGGGGVTLAELEDGTVAILGVGTAGDSTNRLAVRSNGVLFTAIDAGDGGTGDMRHVVNKQSAGGTAGLLFQTGFSGRAEMGTLGDDRFGIKVSADGSSWISGMVVDTAGRVLFGLPNATSIPGSTPELQQNTDSIAAVMLLADWRAGNFGGSYVCAKSRGGSVGTNAAIQEGDDIGRLRFVGNHGAGFQNACNILCRAMGDWSVTSDQKTRLILEARWGGGSLNTVAEFRGDGKAGFPLVGTTASAANAVLDSSDGNTLLRSTSSERYKRDIEPVQRARSDAILALEPIWYRSTGPADRANWSWYGLIAEDVAKIEPRLVHYGYHDDDYELVPEEVEDGDEPSYRRVLKRGAELKPDGVQYDRLAVLLLGVVKRQEARIAALEAALVPGTPGDAR